MIHDDFAGPTLDPAWSASGVAYDAPTMLEPGAMLPFRSGSSLLRPGPAGTDWTFEVEDVSQSTLYSMAGLVFLDDAGNGVGLCSWGGSPIGFLLCQITGGYFDSNYIVVHEGFDPWSARHRLIKRGNDHFAQYSTDGGATWTAEGGPFTLAHTPTKVGLGCWYGDITMQVSDFLEYLAPTTATIVLPALSAEVAGGSHDFLDVDLPALQAGGTGSWHNNFSIVFLPMPTMDLEADVDLNLTVTVDLPALSAEVAGDAPVPIFRKVMGMVDPDVWWSMDEGDLGELITEGDWEGLRAVPDMSGHGYLGALQAPDDVTYPAGLVNDSLDSSTRANYNLNVWTIKDYTPEPEPSPLTSEAFSAFALVDFEDYGPYWAYRTVLFRPNLWNLCKYNSQWMLRISTQYYEQQYVLAPYDHPEPRSVGFTYRVDEDGHTWIQGFFDGAPAPNTPVPFMLEDGLGIATEQDNSFSDLRVVNWTGRLQHAAYFKRALSAGDFGALHASAVVDRPVSSELRASLPALQASTEATIPLTGSLDLQMPSLTFEAYRGYSNRTPAGSASWLTPVALERGKMTQPTPRLMYPMYDDYGLIQPYFSAWWKWTADTTEDVWFSTTRSIPEPGQTIDTQLRVYTEDAGVLTEVFSNDDIGNWRASQVVIESPVLGQTYIIRCGTYAENGSGVAFYILDNDLVPAPTLADLIVEGGYRGPKGMPTQGEAPEISSNSVSQGTHIPAGEQAWWYWTADYNGTISFDALLSQNWFTGGAGSEDPRVGMELWSEGQFLEYSEGHGTVDYEPRGQISFQVTAGQDYQIGMYPLPDFPDINAFLRVSELALGEVVVPEVKSKIIDATNLSGGGDPGDYAATHGEHAVEFAPISGDQIGRACFGFYGHSQLNRSWLGVPPQHDHMGALTCLWSHARGGERNNQSWGKNGTGYWYGADPPPEGAEGRGDCTSNWYASSEISDTTGGSAGVSYWASWLDIGFFLYTDADISVQGTHYQLGISELVKAVRELDDVSDAASFAGISLMPDEPAGGQDTHFQWYVNVTRDKSWNDRFIKQWGPDYHGRWWSSGLTDGEQSAWMTRLLFDGASPMLGGGPPVWTPLPEDLLAQIHTFENDPANLEYEGGPKPRGLTLAYLPREVNQFNPPYQVWKGFDYDTASVGAYSEGCRVLAKVDIQEPAMISGPDPVASGFPAVRPYNVDTDGDVEWPPPYPPGPVGSQILFGPYPVKFSPVIDVLVFGPRHKPIDWPDVAASPQLDSELVTQVPSPTLDPLARPAGSVRFELPEFTVLDGIPVGSKAAGRIAFTSETVAPSLVGQLSGAPHLVDLGEDLRFPPILSTQHPRITTFKRHPTSPLEYRTANEVTSLPSSDGSVTLASPAPGPVRVSTYAYWRGTPAATTAISFRPTTIGEESLIANAGDWIVDDEITVLLTAVLDTSKIEGVLSPLFCAASPAGVPRAGLFFNSDSEVVLWDTTHDVDDVNKRIRGKVQLLDDIRRSSQPVLIGARINNVTGKVTLVAADSRLRTVETSLVSPIATDAQLLIGDAGTLTKPGAFDLLDMRWWQRPLSDAELLTAAAAMTDLWGVLA